MTHYNDVTTVYYRQCPALAQISISDSVHCNVKVTSLAEALAVYFL